jgi:rubrerythrin
MAQMTLEKAIRNGIETERAAERFYRTLADSTEDPEARAFLKEMAEQESTHRDRILDLGKSLNDKELPAYADENIEIVETAPAWADVDNLSYAEALAVALENEHHAVLYYSALCDSVDGNVLLFFQKLVEDEEGHVALLNERLHR